MADVVEGRNPVLEALRAGVPLTEVRIARGVEKAGALAEVRRLCDAAGVPIREVDRRSLDEISARGAHQGVVALARPYGYASVADIVAAGSLRPRSLVVVLDHVTDPGNLGAVARSAEAVGAAGLVIPSKRAADVGPVARKASAGALEHLRVARVPNIPRVLEELKEAGYWVAGASERGPETVWESRLDERLALVMGAEGAGLSRLVSERCDFLVSLPMVGEVGSLNVAQAATVLAYEWLRRGHDVLPLLVVDGYNVLHADPGYSSTANVDMDGTRRRLIDDVAVFASGRYETVIVFDGGGVSPWTPAGVSVRWSLEDDADSIVEALAFEARGCGRPCLVVTTDRATRDAVFGPGVDAVSSAILLGHLDESRDEWRESVESFERVTLADRVGPEVRSRLEGWARGRRVPSSGERPESGPDGGPGGSGEEDV